MKNREKVLAAIVTLILVGWGGQSLFESMLQTPLDAKRKKIARLESDIRDKDLVIERAKEWTTKLNDWRSQSLPTDAALARSAYQNWLLELVELAEFERSNVDSGEAVNKPGAYQKLPFTVRARVTLPKLTQFLYNFYQADHLHLIQRIGITPVANSDALDLSLAIEALVLPQAERREQLSRKPSERLAGGSLEYYDAIIERDLFSTGGAMFDTADYAFLTAILEVGNIPEVWFTIRTSGEIIKLRNGQNFEVGEFHGVIVEIDTQDVVIDSGNERWLLTLGENLSQATSIPPEF